MSLVQATAGDNSTAAFDVERVRADFPILGQEVYGKPLVYLDNAASAQKPRQVIEAMTAAYETYYANVHRGVHHLSQRSTEAFEAGREKLAAHLNAASVDEIVFTRNGTEAINLVAATYGRRFLEAGDEIVISEMEHHSNIVPWHLLCAEKGVVLKAAPIDDEGNLRLDTFESLLGARTKLVAITHISNALGTITPIKQIVRLAHARGIPVLVDGCQAAPHLKIDVQDLDVDFYVVTGHKIYGPSGIGALYGKMALLKTMPPYQGGGEMIDLVTLEGSTFKEPPHRFEAGTPAIVEAIGLGAAIDYINAVGLDNIAAHEAGLAAYAMERLGAFDGIELYGTAKEKTGIVSFNFDGIHAHDVGTILDRAGIAVRAGHHCAQPLMERLGVGATARASFGLYNTRAEVDALVDGLELVREIFG
jgi:cysteine desulfurase/selenocysteine lyase